MLHCFLAVHRDELIERCRSKASNSVGVVARATDEIDHGVPFFLDQLIKTLKVEQSAHPIDGLKVSGGSGGTTLGLSELGDIAAQHGRDLMHRGFTVEQVVHGYGDLCQSITDLAFERHEPVKVEEFRTLNRCLDNAIAMAVAEFNHQRDSLAAETHAKMHLMEIGFFAHELRNFLNTATLALVVITEENLSLSGATCAVLNRALIGMRALIDRSLTDVRMSAGLPIQHQLFDMADFIDELKLSSMLEAHVKKCRFIVQAVECGLMIEADRDLLLSAAGNLLQNAFKFTLPGTEVILSCFARGNRILIEVEDHGKGLLPAEIEKIFHPFAQTGSDRSGLGLGLAIARRCVEANKGVLSVRTKATSGCVFTIDLPRQISSN